MSLHRAALVLVLIGCGAPAPKTASPPTAPRAPTPSGPLRGPVAFAANEDKAARSRALFTEAGKVLQHPRCVNCHPSDDRPRQLAGEPHEPPVVGGPDGHGVPALECASCHQSANAPLSRVPGAPKWALAPIEMAWQGKSLAAICAQLKDPAKSRKSLAEIVEHAAHDPLVAWGFSPGADREPAPGTQATFGALIAAWVETGAHCPEEAR